MYTIILESKHKHKFQFETQEKNEEVAKQEALDKIKLLYYDIYEYKIIEVKKKIS